MVHAELYPSRYPLFRGYVLRSPSNSMLLILIVYCNLAAKTACSVRILCYTHYKPLLYSTIFASNRYFLLLLHRNTFKYNTQVED